MPEFDNTVALVTGGAQGLGEYVSRMLAERGATVAICDVSQPHAEQLAEQIVAAGGRAQAYQCDVRDWDRTHQVVAEVEERFGPVNRLVANAGVSQPIGFLDLTEQDWDRVLDINLKGLFTTLKAVVPTMADRRDGRIVYIGSISSKAAYPRFAHYNASKFGGLGLAQTVALEMAPYGVTMNTVCPGVMNTPMQRDLVHQMVAQNDEFETTEQAEEWFDNMLPLGAPQPIEDVAEMVLYLLSERARHITAASFHVDGGIVPR